MRASSFALLITCASLLTASSVGCAQADAPQISRGVSDAARETPLFDAEAPPPTDANDESSDALFPVEETPPKGICTIPKGTTATANAGSTSAPDLAIDGKLDTVWNSGGYSGNLRLEFPTAITIDRIRLAAGALPVCDESYTIVGYVGGVGTTIGGATRAVPSGAAWLEPFPLTRGSYDEIAIQVPMAASWIALAEVNVYDSMASCP